MAVALVQFDTKVEISLKKAHLSAAGPLLCDPVVKVQEVLFQTTSNRRGAQVSTKEVLTNLSAKVIATSKPKIFTAHPDFGETITAMIPPYRTNQVVTSPLPGGAGTNAEVQTSSDGPRSTDRFLALVVEDLASGVFLGEALCPFSLSVPSKSTSIRRLMLHPRGSRCPESPMFQDDVKLLRQIGLDDFGFIDIEWCVKLEPCGGVPGWSFEQAKPSTPLPPFPIGVGIKAQWLTNASALTARGAHFTTALEIGLSPSDHKQFVIDTAQPVFLAVHDPAQLSTFRFVCTLQQGFHGAAQSCIVPFPLDVCVHLFLNRDVMICHAVVGNDGADWGVLMICVRGTPNPIRENVPKCTVEGCPMVNDPKHQLAFAHEAKDWGRPMPDCPIGAFQPILWENDSHIARSTERRWKRDCVQDASPTVDHLRHLFDVSLGRVQLDPAISQLLSAFLNKAPGSASAAEIKQLLIALSFNSQGVSHSEACRFAFVAMRTEIERAIRVADVVFILEHSLLFRTLDMPQWEVARRVVELFGAKSEGSFVTYEEYQRFFVKNYAFWYDLGVAIEYGPSSSSAPNENGNEDINATSRPVSKQSNSTALKIGPSSKINPAEGGAVESKDDAVWKKFTVRAIKTGRAFNVTSHINDSVLEAMKQIEEFVELPPHRQKWVYEGLTVDPRRSIGNLLSFTTQGKGKDAPPEISVHEKEEMLNLTFVWREKNKKWEHRVPFGDKVLKLRAYVQQKTLIPLSRCKLTYAGNPMWDRHPLETYKLTDGAIIEISTDGH